MFIPFIFDLELYLLLLSNRRAMKEEVGTKEWYLRDSMDLSCQCRKNSLMSYG